jgi:hypothetical protein
MKDSRPLSVLTMRYHGALVRAVLHLPLNVLCDQKKEKRVGAKMAHNDENFRDSSGIGWVIINLLALLWITMPISIALITVVQW